MHMYTHSHVCVHMYTLTRVYKRKSRVPSSSLSYLPEGLVLVSCDGRERLQLPSSQAAREATSPALGTQGVEPAVTGRARCGLRFRGTSAHGCGASLNDLGPVPALAVRSLPPRAMTEG